MADEIKRLNYFLGQFLEAEDFQTEQKYHVDMRRRGHKALYFTAGILDGGFQVTKASDKAIQISAGIGVDAQGRELVILSSVEKQIVGFAPNTSFYVVIEYKEAEADSKTTADNASKGNTRIMEAPGIILDTANLGSTDPDNRITLARIALDANGNIGTMDSSVRQYSNAQFSGKLGIGTTNPSAGLEIDKGATNHVALLLNSSGSGWGSGMQLRNTAQGGKTYGIYSGFGSLHFTDVDNSVDRLLIHSSGNVGIGTNDPKAKLEIVGGAAINDGTGHAAQNSRMASGSLTIGSTQQSYGGGSDWNTNTAGLLLETVKNTEIAVHDSGHRIASLMYYEGDADNRITIGRDMAWGSIGSIVLNGNVGIGTATPVGKLDISGDVSLLGKHAFRGNDPWLRLNQDGAFSSGVHTPGLFAPGSLNVGGKNGWGNPGVGNAWFTGSIEVNGDVAVGGKHAFRGNDPWLRLNQDGAFSSGVHTPGLFAPGSLNVGGIGGWANPGNGNVWVAGNVGIGTTDVREKLHVAGPFIRVDGIANEQAYIGGDGAGGDVQIGSFNGGVMRVSFWNAANGWMDIGYRNAIAHSDERDKHNIADLGGALKYVMKLRGVFFDWKDGSMNNEDKKNIGLIAQEVEKVLPEAVFRSSRGTYGINYSCLLPVVIEALKEQQKEIEEIKVMIAKSEKPRTKGK